jgi:hypothetical protein
MKKENLYTENKHWKNMLTNQEKTENWYTFNLSGISMSLRSFFLFVFLFSHF